MQLHESFPFKEEDIKSDVMKHLYIIGNGFDRHHNIQSGFDQFAEWLEKEHPDLFFYMEFMYQIDDVDLWKDFEHLLGELNVRLHAERIADEHFPRKEKLEECSDREFDELKWRYETSPDEAKDVFEAFFGTIRETFAEWVQQMGEPDITQQMPIYKKDSYFITFNYTDTLQTLYRIPIEQILYIHGNAKQGDDLILGHGLSKGEIEDRCILEPPEEADTPEKIEAFYRNQGDCIIDETLTEVCNQLANQAKPVGELLLKLERNLPLCEELHEIHIWGFSFSDIDMPYIDLIKSKVDSYNVLWEVSYFDDADEAKFRKILVDSGVPDDRIITTKLANIKRLFGSKSLF